MKNLIIAATLITTVAWASFQGFDNSSGEVGHFSQIQCSSDFTCSQSSGKFLMDVTSLNLSDDATIGGTTPYLTIGDAGAEDAGVVFDGNAQDFNISLDDTNDNLVFGLGSAAGTTDALRIDANQDVTVVGNLIPSAALILNSVGTFTDSDATPDVSDKSYWNTNTTSFTITDFDGAGIAAGQLLVVTSKGAITYDVTSSGIKGGTTDIITAAGDVTTFVYDGADWLVVARMDMSDDLN